MQGLKFNRKEIEDPKNFEKALAAFEAREMTEADEKRFAEAVAAGRIVLGPLGLDGEPLGNR